MPGFITTIIIIASVSVLSGIIYYSYRIHLLKLIEKEPGLAQGKVYKITKCYAEDPYYGEKEVTDKSTIRFNWFTTLYDYIFYYTFPISDKIFDGRIKVGVKDIDQNLIKNSDVKIIYQISNPKNSCIEMFFKTSLKRYKYLIMMGIIFYLLATPAFYQAYNIK